MVLFAVIAVFSLTTSHFFSLTTFRTITNQIPAALILVVGLTLVMVAAVVLHYRSRLSYKLS